MLNFQTYEIRRYTKSIVAGVVVNSLASITSVSGNLQPVNDGALSNAPEGFRESPGRKYRLFVGSAVELKSGGFVDGETEPDRLVYNGRLLYVHGFEDRDHGLIPHRVYYLVEPETDADRLETELDSILSAPLDALIL